MPMDGSTIGLKNLVKLEPYEGEKEKFSFKWHLYVAVRLLNKELLPRMQFIEKHVERNYKLNLMSPEEQKLAEEAYTLLALTCRGAAEEYVKAAEENNGFEAWANLCRARSVRSSVALLNQLVLEPKLPSQDARINVKIWQKEVVEYEARTGEKFSETTKSQ